MIGTLRDNIKEVRTCVRRGAYARAEGMLDDILDEMEEPKDAHPSVTTIRDKILMKIEAALDDYDATSRVLDLTTALSRLPE